MYRILPAFFCFTSPRPRQTSDARCGSAGIFFFFGRGTAPINEAWKWWVMAKRGWTGDCFLLMKHETQRYANKLVLWPLLAIGKEDISLINDVFSTPVWIWLWRKPLVSSGSKLLLIENPCFHHPVFNDTHRVFNTTTGMAHFVVGVPLKYP